MDFVEHELTEPERLLRRQGVLYRWTAPSAAYSRAAEPAASSRVASFESNKPKSLSIPESLQALFHGKQSPVHSLWTYAQLQEDLCALQPPPRLEILHKIQAAAKSHLGWLEASLAEWPLDPDLTLFEYGMRHFRPRHLLCFGTCPSLDSHLPARGEGGHVFQGARVYLLPDLNLMATGDQEAKNQAWRILQNILTL